MTLLDAQQGVTENGDHRFSVTHLTVMVIRKFPTTMIMELKLKLKSRAVLTAISGTQKKL